MSWLPPMRRCPPEQGAQAVERALRRLLHGHPVLDRSPRLARRLEAPLRGVGRLAVHLLDEDLRLTESTSPPVAGGLAHPTMDATRAAGDTLRSIADGIGFPQFVESLITGVFQAIWNSSIQQLEAMADLLEAVSKSRTQFEMTEVSDADTVSWLTRKFPFLKATHTPGSVHLELDRGASLTDLKPTLQAGLGATRAELDRVHEGDLQALLTLGRRTLARQRQQNLATLVMMGLNRIVVDRGQLHAEMDMRVDTRSAARKATHDGLSTNTGAGIGAAGIGTGWGASGSVSTSIATVNDTQSQSDEELAATGSLRSFVDITFHSEPVNLDQMASMKLREQILANTRVPDAQYTTGNLTQDHITEEQAAPVAERYEAPTPTVGENPTASAPVEPAVSPDDRPGDTEPPAIEEAGSGEGEAGEKTGEAAGGEAAEAGSGDAGTAEAGAAAGELSGLAGEAASAAAPVGEAAAAVAPEAALAAAALWTRGGR